MDLFLLSLIISHFNSKTIPINHTINIEFINGMFAEYSPRQSSLWDILQTNIKNVASLRSHLFQLFFLQMHAQSKPLYSADIMIHD